MGKVIYILSLAVVCLIPYKVFAKVSLCTLPYQESYAHNFPPSNPISVYCRGNCQNCRFSKKYCTRIVETYLREICKNTILNGKSNRKSSPPTHKETSIKTLNFSDANKNCFTYWITLTRMCQHLCPKF